MKELKLFTYLWIYLSVALDLCGAQDRGSRGSADGDRFRAARERKASRDGQNKLIITTVLKEPYMMLKEQSMGSFLVGNDRFEGYMADIIRNLSQSIGFEYVISLCLDQKYGESDLDGHWNGMIGEIQKGNADIAVGPITITPEREEVVDFTDPFMTFRSTALLKKPHKRRKRNQVETAEDLLESDVMYGTMDGSITQRLMRTSEEPLYRGMWARMVNFWPTPFVQSIEEGIERSRRENFAIIMDTPLAEYIVGQEPCEFYTIEPFLTTRRYGIALTKNDRLREVINGQLRRMHDSQIMTEFYLKWWRSQCDLYLPRAGRKTGPVSPEPTPKTHRMGKVGHLGSSATCHRGDSGLLITSSIIVFFVCYIFSSHDIARILNRE